MRYITKADARKHIGGYLQAPQQIDISGSVQGMIKQFGWKRGHAVRIGNRIYHLDGQIWYDAKRAGIIKG